MLTLTQPYPQIHHRENPIGSRVTNLARYILGKIYRVQTPVITTLARVGKILGDVNTTMVTGRGLAGHHNKLRLMLKPLIHSPHAPQSTLSNHMAEYMLVSTVVLSYDNYYLPLGRISLYLPRNWRYREADQYVAYEESSLAGQWVFEPASWASYRSIRTRARLLAQFGEYSKPRITPGLTFRVSVSEYHPVWKCIEGGDLMGVRRHLSIGSIGVNDTTLLGPIGANNTTLLGLIRDNNTTILRSMRVNNTTLLRSIRVNSTALLGSIGVNGTTLLGQTPLQAVGRKL